MPPLCLAWHLGCRGALPLGLHHRAFNIWPHFRFRALVPGLVAREVFTSHGHWPFACARLSSGIGSHLQCPPVTHCPIWGSAPWSVSRVFLTRRYWLRIQRPVGGVPAHEPFHSLPAAGLMYCVRCFCLFCFVVVAFNPKAVAFKAAPMTDLVSL